MSEFLNTLNNPTPDTSWETEVAALDSAPADKRAVETEAPAAPETKEAAPAGEAAQAAPAGQDNEATGDDVQKVVPLKALQEERRQNREMADRLRQYEEWAQNVRQQQAPPQQVQDERPDIETDPIGAIKWMDQKLRENQESQAVRDNQTRLQSVYAASAQEFATKTPDFSDA